MKCKKRVGGRAFRVQEVEIVRRPAPTASSPIERVVDGVRQLRRHIAHNWSQTEHRVGVFLSRIRHGFENGVGRHLSLLQPPTTTRHVFAAISRKRTTLSTIASLTPHQAEIKRRVSHVPVYLVTRKNGKLIYIKPYESHDEEMDKPIGLLFMAASGARQLLTKVGEDVPETANDLQVISLDLGSLYEMFSNKEQDYLKHVIYRFVPEPDQISNALQVMKQNGFKHSTFSGVPVFHVDGLNAGGQRLRPLFFSKEDLDCAVDSATRKKLERERTTLCEEMEDLKGEAQEARFMAKQKDGDDAEKWISVAAKAEAKARRISKRVQELPDSISSSVRVEVRSLEDVLSEMERDYSGMYGGTMLIPPGLARGDMIEAPFANIGERKIINLQNRSQ